MDAGITHRYNQAVRGVNDDFAAKRAANTFSRTLSQRRGSRNVADYQQNFRRQLPGFQANYANRGLGNSGVYQRALQNYSGDYSQGLGRLQEDQQAEEYQFGLDDASLISQRDRALADLEMQKANEIAMTAYHINSLKPYMG